MAKKPVAKGVVQVTPEVTMNVELDASNLVDIHVAMKEEELIRQEGELESALKAAEKESSDKQLALGSALAKLGKEKAKNMADEVFPTLKSFGFKSLDASCAVRLVDDEKKLVLEYVVVTGKGHNAHGITTRKKDRVPKAIRELRDEAKTARELVQDLKNDALKVKEALSTVDRMERKARAHMAIRALESTSAGRKMLADIKADSVKALPAPRK